VDLAPFLAAAALLYDGPWIAERYAALRAFFEARPEAFHPVTRQVITAATRYSAADAFEAQYRLAALKRATASVWHRIDTLALPTAGSLYTIAALEADPLRLNANLGRYTNFVKPARSRGNRLALGVSPRRVAVRHHADRALR